MIRALICTIFGHRLIAHERQFEVALCGRCGRTFRYHNVRIDL